MKRVFVLTVLLACGGSTPGPKATEAQVACLADRELTIIACVKANPDRASIDPCLARAEAMECTDAGNVMTVAVDAGVQ